MSNFKSFSRLVLVLGALITLSACSTLSKTDDPNDQVSSDPFESWNRSVYKFNNGVDKVALKPVAKAYHCLLYTSPSPRDLSTSRMPSSA